RPARRIGGDRALGERDPLVRPPRPRARLRRRGELCRGFRRPRELLDNGLDRGRILGPFGTRERGGELDPREQVPRIVGPLREREIDRASRFIEPRRLDQEPRAPILNLGGTWRRGYRLFEVSRNLTDVAWSPRPEPR